MANKIVGGALVTGESSFQIPFRSKPRSPTVDFTDPDPAPGCGPIVVDEAEAAAVNVGTSLRPRWVLEVEWDVNSGTRSLAWETSR